MLLKINPQIIKLYHQGHSKSEIARQLKLGVATVWRHLQDVNIPPNYFNDLIAQSVLALKINQKAYCFNEQQLKAIRERYSKFTYGISDGCYILYPGEREVE